MSVQQCTLVDVRDPGDHAKWITVTPQTQFTDNDSVSHSAAVTFNYSSDALPSTAKVPRSDAAGNNPTPVLYTIRRVLGAGGQGNQTWTNVLLNSSTVNLNDLTQVPGITTVVNVVTQVDGVNPDAEGHVTTGSPAAIAAETTRATAAEASNASAITAEASTRASADTTNANAITSEATARAAAVTSEASTRATADTANANAVTAEASTRATADTANANAITSEASTRASADTANASAITAETTRASAAETTNATAISTEATDRTAADLLKADKPIGDDGKVLAWDDGLQAFVDATGKYVDPTNYLIDQANRSAADLASAHNDSVAGDNAILGLVGGATQWAPDTQYAADSLVGYGGLHVFKAAPPSGNVLENIPPFGVGDGSVADRQLLLQRRVGFGAASIGGLNYATITVTSTADYLSTDTPVSGTLRYAIEVTARAAGGGWIIFDKTTFADGAGATIKLKQDLCILTSNITVDGRGASVTITGGDGTYSEGGKPGLPAAVATTYSSSNAYSGTFASPTLVTGVLTDTGSTYCCVDVTAKNQAQDGGLTPITSTRWRKVAAVVTDGTVHYEQSARVVSSDTNTYALVKPIGGYTLSGTVKVSSTACTVDPSSDRHDLNPVTGHWEPIGKIGFCFNVGFMQYSPGSGISAKLTFTDPTGANGIPARNIIVEKISKVDNWGGESNDTGSHRSFQVTGWQKDVWIDRVYVTNPCQWNDGLADVNCPTTNLTFSSCHFKQGHKAILCSGVGIFGSPAVLLVAQVNPDLDAIYGPSGSAPDATYTSGGYALWNDSANVVVKSNKLDSKGHVIDWSTVTFPANGELEHGQANPENVLMLSVDHSNSGYDLVTLSTRLAPKKHLAAADSSGVTFSAVHLNPVTGTDTSAKKCQLYRLAHFLPGLTDDFPRFTDSFGVDWVDTRVTYVDCWMEQLGDRGPHADGVNTIVHVLDCYASDWGIYPDPLIDPGVGLLSYVFPPVPASLVPTIPSSMQTSFGARLFVENSAFEHAVGASGNAAKMLTVASAGPGYLKTANILDVPGDSNRDADALGGDFSAISYAYTARANTVVKARVKQSAGPISLWPYDHEASILADGAVTTAKLASGAVTSAKVDTATVATLTGTQTLTNKRRTRRAVVVTQSATPTVNSDVTDLAKITGLAQAITSMTTNLSGSPVSGDTLEFHITDNGTARAITWGASFVSTTVALPTTTVISTKLRVGFEWDTDLIVWACVAVA